MDQPDNEQQIEELEAKERVYTWREKALRDQFVKEYCCDYDPVGAAMRVGYSRSIAKEFAEKFLSEPYVMREISKREGAAKDEEKEDEDSERKRIIAGLKREANYRGPGSSQAARVAALSKLAQLYGMEPATKTKNEHTGADGSPLAGQFIIPGVMTPEQWAEAAEAQQTALVAGKPTIN